MMKTLQKINGVIVAVTVFLIPFYFLRFSVLDVKTNIFEIAVLMSLITTILIIIKIRKYKLQKNWILPSILLLVALISVSFVSDKEKALGIFKGWFLVPIVFGWIVSRNPNNKNISAIAIPLYISVLIISFWAILQRMGIISTLFYQSDDPSFSQYITNGRAFGPFESPNFLAMFLVPAVFLSLPVMELAKSKLSKIIILVSFAIPVLGLYFSGSRAGYITFFICLLLFLNYKLINLQKTRDRKPFFSVLFIFLFVIINIGYLFFVNYFNSSNESDVIRTEIYRYSEILIKDQPFLGVGLGQFQSSIRELSTDNIFFQTKGLSYALHPHNLFLSLWLNLGIVGLIVFTWILLILFKGLYHNDSKYKSYFIAAAFAILIHGLFDTSYFKNDLSAIFWLIFACSIILSKNEIKNINN